jgi:hypothetical protein
MACLPAMLPSFRMGLALALLLSLNACAYRHHTTPLQTVPNPPKTSQEWPAGVYGLRLQQAEARQVKLSGLAWDDDGTLPDVFVRIFVEGRQIWQSEVAKDDDTPVWNVGLPANVVIPQDAHVRLELWDWDTPLSADPMGHSERRGLPNALPGTESRIVLNTGAVVTLMTMAPEPRRGVGLSVELQPNALKVLKVEPYSPAARAGIKVGDRITSVGHAPVSELSEDKAASELSLAVDRQHALGVANSDGSNPHEVKLDQGYVWLVL